MSVDTYPKCVADKLAEIRADLAKVEAMAALGQVCEEVAAEFPDTMVCIPSIGEFTHYITIRKSLEEAVAIIRAYRKRGVKMIRYEDRPQSHCRQYYMEGVSVYVSLPIADDGASPQSCAFVKVGTKTVEQPVYEIRCEGAE